MTRKKREKTRTQVKRLILPPKPVPLSTEGKCKGGSSGTGLKVKESPKEYVKSSETVFKAFKK